MVHDPTAPGSPDREQQPQRDPTQPQPERREAPNKPADPDAPRRRDEDER